MQLRFAEACSFLRNLLTVKFINYDVENYFTLKCFHMCVYVCSYVYVCMCVCVYVCVIVVCIYMYIAMYMCMCNT